MPKNVCKTVPVHKKVFLHILKIKNSSIRKLGEAQDIDCSEKTIRRELNSGGLREQYVEQIAKHLNVDSRLLTGELVKNAFATSDKVWQRINLQPLDHVEDFPYFRAEQEKLRKENISETLRRILSLFEISYDQFEAKNFEEQYEFQHDLFSAILPVMFKHYDKDGYGNTDGSSMQKIIFDLENYRDDYYESQHADTVVRKRFMDKPPKGYTKDQIKRMSPDEIISLDLYLQDEQDGSVGTDELAEKYKDYTDIT